MIIKAIDLKNWCTENFSPLAWSRVTLRSLTIVRECGLDLDQIQNPDAQLKVTGNLLDSLCESIEEIYKVEVPLSTFVKA